MGLKLMLRRKVRSANPLITARSTKPSMNIFAHWFWMSENRMLLETIVILIDLRLTSWTFFYWRRSLAICVTRQSMVTRKTRKFAVGCVSLPQNELKVRTLQRFCVRTKAGLYWWFFVPIRDRNSSGLQVRWRWGRGRAWQSENARFLKLKVGWLVLWCRKLWGAESAL